MHFFLNIERYLESIEKLMCQINHHCREWDHILFSSAQIETIHNSIDIFAMKI